MIKRDQIVISKVDEFKFHYLRGRGHLVRYLRNRILWNFAAKFNYIGNLPDHVDIEISTVCNMTCPMCYTQTEKFKRQVKKDFMPFGLFKKIADECSKYGVFSVRLSLRGEPAIHPDFIKMIEYIRNNTRIREISFLTNMLALNTEMMENIVRLKVDWVTLSIDGLGQTYENIRKPAKFDDVVSKVRKFNEIKSRMNSRKPALKVQSIWPAIEKDFNEYIRTFKPYVDLVSSNPLSDNFNKIEYRYLDSFSCPVLYQRMVVTPGGEAILCCNDDYSQVIIGNAGEQSLFDIWHGDKMLQVRQLHKQVSGYKALPCCRECHMARETVETEETIEGKNVKVLRFKESHD